LGFGVKVLLCIAAALSEGRRCRLVENADAGSRSNVHVHAVETSVIVKSAGSYAPHLTGRERVAAYLVSALQLRSSDELLDVVLPNEIREVGVAELRRADTFLLLLDPPAALEREPDGPLEFFVGDGFEDVGVEEFEQAADGLLDGGGVASREGASELDAAVEGGDAAFGAEAIPTLREEVTHQANVLGEEVGAHFGYVLAR